MDEKVHEAIQELLDRLEYMENAIQILLQLTTLNAERTADVYNTVMAAGKRAGFIRDNVEDGLN